MADRRAKPVIESGPLPVEIALHPSWWYKNEGICFDEDFFFHPARRVEAERKMEQVLHERFGRYGLGADRDGELPVVGAVHNAAGFLLSEMLGCKVVYSKDTPPQVLVADREKLTLDADAAFESPAFRRFERLCSSLKEKHGYLLGDVNWGGVLNLALDLRGQALFLDLFDRADDVRGFFEAIAACIERFTRFVSAETGTTSISVNRIVRHLSGPVFLHSECSLTMISAEHYEKFLMPYDTKWSKQHRPFGIHYCGMDPHRHAEMFAKLPNLDFLDVGWGGDIKKLRALLPDTFLSIRLSPVEIAGWSTAMIEENITRLVKESGDPMLTGVCCINMDESVSDEKICALFDAVHELRSLEE